MESSQKRGSGRPIVWGTLVVLIAYAVMVPTGFSILLAVLGVVGVAASEWMTRQIGKMETERLESGDSDSGD